VPDLRILFAKAKDPSSQDVLTCVRRDGSRTWSRLHAAFPVHDMTHYAVETEMQARDGFFGLLAQGWDITDFGIPEKRARMPLEAIWVEHVVGVVWREFVTRETTSYEEFCASIQATLAALRSNLNRHSQRQGPRPDYSEAEMGIIERGIPEESRARIMAKIGELAASWSHTPRGEVLELAFDIGR
jgi:hypothetical protein